MTRGKPLASSCHLWQGELVFDQVSKLRTQYGLNGKGEGVA